MRHDLSSKTLMMTGSRTGIQRAHIISNSLKMRATCCAMGVATGPSCANRVLVRIGVRHGRSRSSYVYGIGKDPECPAVPSCETGLLQVRFGAVVARTGYGKVETRSLLMHDLTSVAQHANECRTCRGRQLDVQGFSWSPSDRVAGARARCRCKDTFREFVGGRKSVDCAEGVPCLNCAQDGVCSSAIGVPPGHVRQQDVLSRQAEYREIAGEMSDTPAVDQHIGVGIGAADARHMAVLKQLVPFGKVLVGRARQPQQGEP